MLYVANADGSDPRCIGCSDVIDGVDGAAIYRALLDAAAIAAWRVPDGMTSQVHELDAREGGRFRISLSYDAPTGGGKTSPNTDTYRGTFAKLVPEEQVVELIAFETADPAMQGEMRVTTTLREAGGGTDVLIEFEGLPPGLSAADNEIGTRMALAKLAALVMTMRSLPDGAVM